MSRYCIEPGRFAEVVVGWDEVAFFAHVFEQSDDDGPLRWHNHVRTVAELARRLAIDGITLPEPLGRQLQREATGGVAELKVGDRVRWPLFNARAQVVEVLEPFEGNGPQRVRVCFVPDGKPEEAYAAQLVIDTDAYEKR